MQLNQITKAADLQSDNSISVPQMIPLVELWELPASSGFYLFCSLYFYVIMELHTQALQFRVFVLFVDLSVYSSEWKIFIIEPFFCQIQLESRRF